MRIANYIFIIVLCGAATAQNTGRTVRHHRVAESAAPAVSADVTNAEDALARNDFAAAEQLLKKATAANSKDYRAWYDLGFVYNATDRRSEAIEAYRQSVAADPNIFESNLNLGLALAANDDADAEKYLRAATHLKPASNPQEGSARAWLALGGVLDKKDVQAAVVAFREAAKLKPLSAEPHLAAAIALENSGDLSGAEAEFQQAARLDPKSTEALAGLVNVYTTTKRLPEAEAALRTLVTADPQNATAHVQLGRVLAAEKKNDEAAAELQIGLKLAPGDVDARRELAGLHASAQQYDLAAAEYRELLKLKPNDAETHFALGTLLMNQKRFAESQAELIAAVKLDPKMADAWGNLAVVAAENNQYGLAIQAVNERAKLVPEDFGTYYLRATVYDHMRDYKQAADNYHQFLTASNGKFPDLEWKARHRLVAIEPKKK